MKDTVASPATTPKNPHAWMTFGAYRAMIGADKIDEMSDDEFLHFHGGEFHLLTECSKKLRCPILKK